MSVADAAISAAVGAIEGAQTSLEYAPAGKGTESDIEQLRADLGGAESDLSAARSAVSREDFEAATSKATSAKGAAVEIAGAVQQAVVKYNDLVEKNKPWYLKNQLRCYKNLKGPRGLYPFGPFSLDLFR